MGNLSSGKSALVHRYLTGTYVQEESPEGEHHRLAWAVKLAALPPLAPGCRLCPGGWSPSAVRSLLILLSVAVGSPGLGPDHALCPRGSV